MGLCSHAIQLVETGCIQLQALGRKVKNFNTDLWSKHLEQVGIWDLDFQVLVIDVIVGIRFGAMLGLKSRCSILVADRFRSGLPEVQLLQATWLLSLDVFRWVWKGVRLDHIASWSRIW